MVDVAADGRTRLDDFLQLDLDEVIVRVDVLLNQTLDLEEGREQIPFILGRVDGIGQRLVIVEGFEQRIEWIPVAIWIGNVGLFLRLVVFLLLFGWCWLGRMGSRFRLSRTLSSRIGCLGLSSSSLTIIPC